MEGEEQALKGDKCMWWEQGDVTLTGASARTLSRIFNSTSEAKCSFFGKERAQPPLPLESKGEEEGMGRGKERLW